MWPFSSETKSEKIERLLQSWNVTKEDLEDGIWTIDEDRGLLFRSWEGMNENRVRRIVREEIAKPKGQ